MIDEMPTNKSAYSRNQRFHSSVPLNIGLMNKLLRIPGSLFNDRMELIVNGKWLGAFLPLVEVRFLLGGQGIDFHTHRFQFEACNLHVNVGRDGVDSVF